MIYLVQGKPSNLVGAAGDSAHDEEKKIIYMRDKKGWDSGTIYRETGVADENAMLRDEVQRLRAELARSKRYWLSPLVLVAAAATFVANLLRLFVRA